MSLSRLKRDGIAEIPALSVCLDKSEAIIIRALFQVDSVGLLVLGRFEGFGVLTLFPDGHVDTRNEQEGRYGAEHQPAYNRSTQRNVLFSAFTEAKCHWRHTDDHGQSSH